MLAFALTLSTKLFFLFLALSFVVYFVAVSIVKKHARPAAS